MDWQPLVRQLNCSKTPCPCHNTFRVRMCMDLNLRLLKPTMAHTLPPLPDVKTRFLPLSARFGERKRNTFHPHQDHPRAESLFHRVSRSSRIQHPAPTISPAPRPSRISFLQPNNGHLYQLDLQPDHHHMHIHRAPTMVSLTIRSQTMRTDQDLRLSPRHIRIPLTRPRLAPQSDFPPPTHTHKSSPASNTAPGPTTPVTSPHQAICTDKNRRPITSQCMAEAHHLRQ